MSVGQKSKGDVLAPITGENVPQQVFQELDIDALHCNLITAISVLFLLLGNVADASRYVLHFQAQSKSWPCWGSGGKGANYFTAIYRVRSFLKKSLFSRQTNWTSIKYRMIYLAVNIGTMSRVSWEISYILIIQLLIILKCQNSMFSPARSKLKSDWWTAP